MASPEGDTPGTSTETGTGFSETQLKTLAGMMEQMLDKALKGRGQVEVTGGGGGETSGQADTNKETPGEPGMEGPRAWRVGQQADQGAQGSAGSGAGGQGQGSGPRAQPAGQARSGGGGAGRGRATGGGAELHGGSSEQASRHGSQGPETRAGGLGSSQHVSTGQAAGGRAGPSREPPVKGGGTGLSLTRTFAVRFQVSRLWERYHQRRRYRTCC